MNTKMILLSASIGLLVLTGAMGALVAFATQRAGDLSAQAGQAEDVMKETFRLNVLSQDYILYRTERALVQWNIQFRYLEDALLSPALQENPSRSMLGQLRIDMDAVREAFGLLVARIEGGSPDVAVEQDLAGDLLVKTERMILDADQLASRAIEERAAMRARTDGLLFLLLGLLATLANILLFLFFRRYASLERLVLERTHDLEELSKRNGTLLECIGDGVVAIDRSWNIMLFNRAASALSGWPASEALGKPLRGVLRFVREQDRKENLDFIEHAIIAGKTATMENHTVLIRKDGTEIPVGDSAAPVFDDDGRVTGAIIVFRDATLERTSAMLRSDFAYASHQLRTPVNKALWGLDAVSAATKNKQWRAQLNESKFALRSISKICSQLLEISDIDQGRVIPKRMKIRVADVMRPITEQAKIFSERTSSRFVIGKIPKSVWLRTDARILERAFTEVLSNAFLYGAGNVVTIQVERREQQIIFEIGDQGIGILERDQPLVYTKFFRGSNIDTTTTIGAGLGLYIARQYVEMLGGKIWFESQQDVGTKVYITFPSA